MRGTRASLMCLTGAPATKKCPVAPALAMATLDCMSMVDALNSASLVGGVISWLLNICCSAFALVGNGLSILPVLDCLCISCL